MSLPISDMDCRSSQGIQIRNVHNASEQDIQQLLTQIRTIPNFPKEGILFRDILPIISNPATLRTLLTLLEEIVPVPLDSFDVIAGPEARGFILGTALAVRWSKGFIPVRKAGKLPPQTIAVDYELEYGSARLEIEKKAICQGTRVLIVDDLIATGGSVRAVAQLVEQAGGEVAGCLFAAQLEGLGGIDSLPAYPSQSLITMQA